MWYQSSEKAEAGHYMTLIGLPARRSLESIQDIVQIKVNFNGNTRMLKNPGPCDIC